MIEIRYSFGGFGRYNETMKKKISQHEKEDCDTFSRRVIPSQALFTESLDMAFPRSTTVIQLDSCTPDCIH